MRLYKIIFFCCFIISATNLFSQVKIDTTFGAKQTWQSYIVPAALIGYGISTQGNHGFPSSLTVKNELQKQFPKFHTRIDDGLVFVPIAAVYGFNFINIRGKNNLKDVTWLYIGALAVSNAIMQPLKYTVKTLRPDGSTRNSFPSGHTTMAFVAAEMMHQEYGNKSIWYSIGGYSVATATGALRMLNNRHWYADVLTGAGIGIASTKLTYWLYSKIFKKKKSF